MKFSDLFSMCFHNLFRRKLRTSLTVTGVVIGTCSIVLMVSLGVGLSGSFEDQLTQWSDITMIEVYGNEGMDNGNNGTADDNQPQYVLNEEAVEYIKSLPHVDGVSPILSIGSDMVRISSGRYVFGGSIVGVDLTQLEKMGYVIKDGRIATEKDKEGTAVLGEKVGYSFFDPKDDFFSPYDENGKLLPPQIDPMKNKLQIQLIKQNDGEAPTYVPVQTKTGTLVEKLNPVGVLELNQAKDYNTYDGIYMDVNFVRDLQKQYAKINGTKDSFKAYSNIKIKVDDFSNVESVESRLKEFGFNTYSAKQELEQTKKITALIQLALGALGGISLLVAAIGITNTMVMSIYERTREIGIIKVLGCELKNIRKMFLMEAGGLGLLGGVVGLIISYGISAIINLVAKMFMSDMEIVTKISQIPPWLALLGIGFAVVVGLIAGYAPANRAVKISALSAIKTE